MSLLMRDENDAVRDRSEWPTSHSPATAGYAGVDEVGKSGPRIVIACSAADSDRMA